MCIPAPSSRLPSSGRHSLGRLRATWRIALTALRCAERGLLGAGKAFVGSNMGRKRRSAADGERLAEAMMRYAELCMSAGRKREELNEAATYLDEAASLYKQMGRPEDAARALALKTEADLGEHNRR